MLGTFQDIALHENKPYNIDQLETPKLIVDDTHKIHSFKLKDTKFEL
jgi:hypothetical protein